MANTLTNQIGIIYAAKDSIDKKPYGLSDSVDRDSSLDRIGLNQTINIHQVPTIAAGTITPAATVPQPSDMTIGNITASMATNNEISWFFTSDEQRSLDSGGSKMSAIQQDLIEKGMQTHLSNIEDLIAAEHIEAVRAEVPDGTVLFDAANYNDLANINKLLDDEGCGEDRTLVLSTAAAARLQGNSTWSASNTAGSSSAVRDGVLLDSMGLKIKKSVNIVTNFTQGDLTGDADVDATEPVGETSISVDAGGTGGVVVGDVVNIAGDNAAHYYVVSTANADLDSGNLDIRTPGLLAQAVAGNIVTLQSASERNMAFSKDAILLITRVAARDNAAGDGQIFTLNNGISFELVRYEGFHQTSYFLTCTYGVKTVNPNHLMLLVD